jgi:hypothetical protein
VPFQIDVIVLQGSAQLLDEDVVHPSTAGRPWRSQAHRAGQAPREDRAALLR